MGITKNIVTFKWDSIPKQRFLSGNIHKTNTKYNAYYVNRHYENIGKRLQGDFNYICVTDNSKDISNEITTIPLWDKCRDLGGCYNRLFIFSEEAKSILPDKFLTIDLDTTIIRDFSHLFKETDKDAIFYKFINAKQEIIYQPGISLVKPGKLSELWDEFYSDYENNIKISQKEFNGTDQAWVNYYIKYKLNKSRINCWTEEDGIYLISHITGGRFPSNSCILNWAGPRDPYQSQSQRQFIELKEYL